MRGTTRYLEPDPERARRCSRENGVERRKVDRSVLKNAEGLKNRTQSVRILPNTTGNPPGKLADAEVIFEAEAGPFTGLTLIGFAVWERRAGGGRNVTFPARAREILASGRLRLAR